MKLFVIDDGYGEDFDCDYGGSITIYECTFETLEQELSNIIKDHPEKNFTIKIEY